MAQTNYLVAVSLGLVMLFGLLACSEPAQNPPNETPNNASSSIKSKQRKYPSTTTPSFNNRSSSEFQSKAVATRARVIEIVDGDTLKVRHIEGPALPSATIRLIGVDTREVHGEVESYGPEASRFAKQKLQGKIIGLDERRQRERPVWASASAPLAS